MARIQISMQESVEEKSLTPNTISNKAQAQQLLAETHRRCEALIASATERAKECDEQLNSRILAAENMLHARARILALSLRAEIIEDLSSELARAVAFIVEEVLGAHAVLRHHALIRRIQRALTLALRPRVLKLSVNASDRDSLEAQLRSSSTEAISPSVPIVSDDAIAPGDAIIHTSSGDIQLSLDQHTVHLLDVLNDLVASQLEHIPVERFTDLFGLSNDETNKN